LRRSPSGLREERQLFRSSDYTYGSQRITLDLWEAAWQVSVNTVADIMAEHGWAVRQRQALCLMCSIKRC
jgi:hypothetical protein